MSSGECRGLRISALFKVHRGYLALELCCPIEMLPLCCRIFHFFQEKLKMCVYGVCACVSVKVTNQKKKISVHSKERKEGGKKKEGKKESQ